MKDKFNLFSLDTNYNKFAVDWEIVITTDSLFLIYLLSVYYYKC